MPTGPPTLTSLLALAAMLLGLSVAVQILQEVWKFFTSSRAKAFSNVLFDFVGPWSKLLTEDGPTSLLQVRGPFQFFKHRPGGKLLPAKKEDLLEAMDKMLGGWIRYSLAILKRERRLQAASSSRGKNGTGFEQVPPSDALQKLRRDLQQVDERAPGYADATRIAALMNQYATSGGVGDRGTLDADLAVEAIYQEFFSERLLIDQHYDQLMTNFTYAYERRNLRQTFVIAFLFAFAFAFPFEDLFRQATQMSPEQAIALAQQTKDLYERVNPSEKYPIESKPNTGSGPEAPGKTTAGNNPSSSGLSGTEASIHTTPPAKSSGSAAKGLSAVGSTDTGDTSGSLSGGSSEKAVGDLNSALEILSKVSIESTGTTSETPADFYLRGVYRVRGFRTHPLGLLGYLFGCLICFGAPFWSRLTTSLLSKAQPSSAVPRDPVLVTRED